MVESSLLYGTRKVCPLPPPLFMIQEKQSTYLPVGGTEAEFNNIQRLSAFIAECFIQSSESRRDQIVEVVRESIAAGIWYPCLQDLDNWSDWDRFAALEL